MKNEKSKHTPGPWVEDMNGEIFGGMGRYICNPFCLNAFSPKIEVQEANARLIAAAPDLLAALESIKAALEDGNALTEEGLEDMHAIARAAIAKAKRK